MKELIYKISPNFIQNLIIGIFNLVSYRARYGGNYKMYLQRFKNNNDMSYDDIIESQEKRWQDFIASTIKKSSFYRKLYSEIELPVSVADISKLPMVHKEMLRNNIQEIYTIQKKKGIISKTGGTTGKSLEVIYTPENMQERFAMLDNFRGALGYTLGKKTAWFSGKNILVERDIEKNRFWKTDPFHNVRYYSTFHISEKYLAHYLQNLIHFQPEFLIGFPSTIMEIARYGVKNNIIYPKNTLKAIFPTAETITAEMRSQIESFYGCQLYDQYASSEGAPFIFECKNNNLHLELRSGIFEVLDDNNLPAKEGRLVCTSFTTEGTPLIRYDIGDVIKMSTRTCTCDNNNPLVDYIHGRVDDYVFSEENGKINLGNVSNTTKGVRGLIKFQVIQNKLDEININIQVDDTVYQKKDEKIFLENWKHRLGEKTILRLNYVDHIPSEKSGKYRLIKNNIKHLL